MNVSAIATPIKDIGEENLKLYKKIKQLVSKKVFVGTYAERRYVESFQVYRDVVAINREETDLISNLKQIQDLVSNGDSENSKAPKYFFFSETSLKENEPKDHCIWVDLGRIPFGKYWFQIQSVKFTQKEVYLQLKILRVFSNDEGSIMPVINDFPTFQEVFTYQNICSSVKFTSVVLMTLITFLVNLSYFLAEYFIILLRETSVLIKAATPMVLGMFEFFSRCVGGLYWLILMLWKGDSFRPAKASTNYPAIANTSYNQKTHTPYNSYRTQALNRRYTSYN